MQKGSLEVTFFLSVRMSACPTSIHQRILQNSIFCKIDLWDTSPQAHMTIYGAQMGWKWTGNGPVVDRMWTGSGPEVECGDLQALGS